jgi:5-methylcytosine-specific restriction enzyme subunit McrC
MEGLGVSLDNEDQVKFEGFLFDMNRFFQALLSRFINEYLTGYNVQDEFRLHDMMKYQPGKNPQGHLSPCPRPDFAIFKENTLMRLLDAKYRDLWAKPPTRDMLYQLSIYALSQEPGPKSQAAILYPTFNRSAKEAIIVINDPVTTCPRGMVTMRPVNLAILDELIQKRGTLGAEKKAAGYAYKLAFGEAVN